MLLVQTPVIICTGDISVPKLLIRQSTGDNMYGDISLLMLLIHRSTGDNMYGRYILHGLLIRQSGGESMHGTGWISALFTVIHERRSARRKSKLFDPAGLGKHNEVYCPFIRSIILKNVRVSQLMVPGWLNSSASINIYRIFVHRARYLSIF